MAGTKNGLSKNLLKIYFVTHIKSLINYGLPIYSSAAPTNLNKINIVYNSAVRLITGAWNSSPIHALYCEAGILPLDQQPTVICASHLAKLKAAPADHPIQKIYFRGNLINLIFGEKIYKTPLFCRVKNSSISQQLNDLIDEIRPAEKQVFPPWRNLEEMVFTTPVDAKFTKSTINMATIFKGMVDKHIKEIV